jgi:simple sugar transport system substrate-binding protein
MLGARSVSPNMKIKVVWANTWYDPGKEADAAKALIDQGADIISQHTDSPGPLQVAENRGVKGFGQASDMIAFAPKAQLTAIVDNWDGYYVARAKAVLDGTWSSSDTFGGFKSDMVEMAPFTNMPVEVAKLAAATVEKIKSGTLHPFQGPLRNQAGELVLKEGERLGDDKILSMDWYVEGVEGKLPK